MSFQILLSSKKFHDGRFLNFGRKNLNPTKVLEI